MLHKILEYRIYANLIFDNCFRFENGNQRKLCALRICCYTVYLSSFFHWKLSILFHIIIFLHLHIIFFVILLQTYFHESVMKVEEYFRPGFDQEKWRRTEVLICACWDDGLGQTGSSGLWFVVLNLSSESPSLHYCQEYNYTPQY